MTNKERIAQNNEELEGIKMLAQALGSVVKSVNGKTGDVDLTASDVGADASGTAAYAVATHNVSTSAHNDIRLLVTELTSRLNALANSDDTTLDQLSEIVAYIKANRTVIESVTTTKVNISDIVDNLTTSATNKPLSANQGVALKALINDITVPTKLSQLTNDRNFVVESQLLESGAEEWTFTLENGSTVKKVVILGNSDTPT